jgi:hypothetical protein
MFVSPASRIRPITVFRRAAITYLSLQPPGGIQ